jgi:hypothetical protein
MFRKSMPFSTHVQFLGLLIGLTTCSPLRADFISIAQPNAAYVAATTLLDFQNAEGTLTAGIAGPGETLIYSSNLVEWKVPGTWNSWNTPPAVESATPNVGSSNQASSLLIGLSAPVSIFGLEIGPDNLAQENVVVSFYSGTSLVGSVQRSPDGNGGALLFAASTTTDPFTSISIENLTGGDFAIARQRFRLESVPEPGSLFLLGIVLIPLALVARRRTLRVS